ncbi:tRNA (adenosine(37)-N6)-dimethylallyltransferase MiaA [Pedobacter sp. SYP-B3415]|uniref:tRNA (adenosine(37)-N6)-dimethylallyltransferase MiaA n=1 Tax=Pedobacter sp. SYP-B3415 TaxID=2496641 RepID=UPI00101B6332|nr:tRNA (adenosine(37)-N6)-dimethylallyltransferase MiaA [Pedobacter sp. SYP-B3415]
MSDQEIPNLIVILGPTASGKTRLAVRLATILDAEIISADSRQVFKGMDIGTGKDLTEYETETGSHIPYHLIDILPAGASYDVAQYTNDFYRTFEDITRRGKRAILCGGTGLYIHALLKNYQETLVPVNMNLRQRLEHDELPDLIRKLQNFPESLRLNADTGTKKRTIRAIEKAMHLQENSMPQKARPRLIPVVFGLELARDERWSRIEKRLDDRLQAGLVAEAEQLLANGVSADQLKFYGLEYKYLAQHLEGALDRAQLREQLNFAIRQFTKRQMTFFRKMEKDGIAINWLPANTPIATQTEAICQILAQAGLEFPTKPD